MTGGNGDEDDEDEARGTYASPPCFMHELDPTYLGLPAGPRRTGAGTVRKAGQQEEQAEGAMDAGREGVNTQTRPDPNAAKTDPRR